MEFKMKKLVLILLFVSWGALAEGGSKKCWHSITSLGSKISKLFSNSPFSRQSKLSEPRTA